VPAEDVALAGVAAAIVSAFPSTLVALASGGDPLEATLAAGSIVLPRETRPRRLAAVAVPLHLVLSVAWTAVVHRVLPRRGTVAAGAAAGLGIAVVDLGVIGRHFPRIRALPLVPQLADHVVFGATAAWVLARRR
jgi:hypothetical protein